MSHANGQAIGELYGKVTAITEDYLGPATERFMFRIVTNHLSKKPEDITATDLPTLVQWTKVSLGLLTEDKSLVDEYERRLNELQSEYNS